MANGNAAQDSTATPQLTIDPSLAATLQALRWPSDVQAGGMSGTPQVLPPTSPVNPAPGAAPMNNPNTGLQVASEQIGRQRDLASQLTPLLARQEAMSRPQSQTNPEGLPQHWKPGYEPVTGAKSFLRDAGRGVLQALSLTGPGQAVEQGLYERKFGPYLTARQGLAQQISDIQKQEELEQKPVGPMGELAYHQELIGTKDEQNRIRQQLADQARINEQDKDTNAKARLDLQRQTVALRAKDIAQKYDVQQKALNLRAKNLTRQQWKDQADNLVETRRNEIYQAGIDAGLEKNEARLNAAQAASQTKMDNDHWAQRFFGVESKIPPRNPQSARAGAGGGSVQVRDPRGVIHTFPDQNSANNFKKAAGIK